jgi:hypothetical protein
MLLAFSACALLLTACTGAPAAAPSPTPSPTIDWTARLASFIDKYGQDPAASAPYTEEEARAVAELPADTRWLQVVMQFPTAVRPSDGFVHWAASPSDPDLTACILATGATPETGVDSDGNQSVGYSYGSDIEGYTIGTYACDVRFPGRASPPENEAQLSYRYDYLTRFVVPCYEAHGAPVDPAPTRAEFIAQYQPDHAGTRWSPLPPNAGDAPDPIFDGKNAVCPLTFPSGAGG